MSEAATPETREEMTNNIIGIVQFISPPNAISAEHNALQNLSHDLK